MMPKRRWERMTKPTVFETSRAWLMSASRARRRTRDVTVEVAPFPGEGAVDVGRDATRYASFAGLPLR